MSTDLESIKKTLVNVSRGDSILDTLLEFERTLDNSEIFTYKNWMLGELVEGPEIGRYWFKTTWMYPYEMMPDPNGGLRLTKIGAKVGFRKGVFKRPVKVKGPQDWVDPESKRAKMLETEVWLVTIELPMKYIDRGLERIDDIIQQDIDKTNAELADAYGDDMPEEPAQPDASGMGDMEDPGMGMDQEEGL
jgi:hypothetical protein